MCKYYDLLKHTKRMQRKLCALKLILSPVSDGLNALCVIHNFNIMKRAWPKLNLAEILQPFPNILIFQRKIYLHVGVCEILDSDPDAWKFHM